MDLATDRNFHWYKSPLAMHVAYVEGNMAYISQTIPIDTSINHGVIENIFIWVDCTSKEIVTYTALFKEYRSIFARSYEEMQGIDP